MLGIPFLQLLILYTPTILGFAGVFYIALRAVRAFERRSTSRREVEEMQERMVRIEEANAVMTERLERLSDGQEFTSKLLAERK